MPILEKNRGSESVILGFYLKKLEKMKASKFPVKQKKRPM